jgi:hypothetical protein
VTFRDLNTNYDSQACLFDECVKALNFLNSYMMQAGIISHQKTIDIIKISILEKPSVGLIDWFSSVGSLN